jgi:hypothetical protein
MKFLILIAAVISLAIAIPAGASSIPKCTHSDVVVWLDTMGNGAAGSTYYNLQFSNLSGAPCSLEGYPKVQAIGLRGFVKGASSSDNSVIAPKTITLQPVSPSNSANTISTSILRITDAGNYPPSLCNQVSVAGLLVTLPGETKSLQVPFPFTACTKDANILSVEAFQKGILGG